MDIAALSINLNQSLLQNQVQISLMKMTMENSSIINNNMTEMLDNIAIDPSVGNNLDIKV